MASAATSASPTLFDVLWDAIADVMGTATTATLLRRAAKRGGARDAGRLELAALDISRDGLVYRYQLPASWADPGVLRDAVCLLLVELRPLLAELTGSVVVRRLDDMPELKVCGPSLTEAL